MARFVYGVLENFSDILSHLPDNVHQRALQLQVDGLAASKQQIISKHVLESSAKSLSSAVALRRFAWLHSTSLLFETRTLIEDLPFDGSGLFHNDRPHAASFGQEH